MYPEICHCDEQAFDNTSEESENNNFIIKKSLRPVPSQGKVEQAKKHGGVRPQRGYLGNALRPPDSEVADDRLMKDIIK